MRKVLFTAAAIACGTVGAHAADLIIAEEPPMMEPAAADYSIYFELLGGVALAGTLYYDGDGDPSDEVPLGGAIAGVVGFGAGIEGLSVEGDFFLAQRDYGDENDDSYTLTTATAMAALKYTVSLGDSLGLYAAVGLGGVYLHDEDAGGGDVYADSWGLGYLLKAGVTAQVADHISLVGEVRYANSFEPITGLGSEGNEQIGTTAVLAGIHIGF